MWFGVLCEIYLIFAGLGYRVIFRSSASESAKLALLRGKPPFGARHDAGAPEVRVRRVAGPEDHFRGHVVPFSATRWWNKKYLVPHACLLFYDEKWIIFAAIHCEISKCSCAWLHRCNYPQPRLVCGCERSVKIKLLETTKINQN